MSTVQQELKIHQMYIAGQWTGAESGENLAITRFELQSGVLRKTTMALYAIDVERLVALAPEVIITQAQCDVCAVRYEDVAAAVVFLAGEGASFITGQTLYVSATPAKFEMGNLKPETRKKKPET